MVPGRRGSLPYPKTMRDQTNKCVLREELGIHVLPPNSTTDHALRLLP